MEGKWQNWLRLWVHLNSLGERRKCCNTNSTPLIENNLNQISLMYLLILLGEEVTRSRSMLLGGIVLLMVWCRKGGSVGGGCSGTQGVSVGAILTFKLIPMLPVPLH